MIVAITTLESDCSDGDVRLVGGSGSHEGRVEVCVNRAWGTICDNNWTTEDANIVCSQLGFQYRGKLCTPVLARPCVVMLQEVLHVVMPTLVWAVDRFS